MQRSKTIAIIGLGYVGLPLAVEFGKKYKTIGVDTNSERIKALASFADKTLEVSAKELKAAKQLSFTTEIEETKEAKIYIVTVPTPVDQFNNPNLNFVKRATADIASVLKKGDIVIYESTVYPGFTEDICIPILTNVSGLKYNHDFFCGYSPERINPGDKVHTITQIKKITSGSNVATANEIDLLYQSIISAGTFKVSCIKVAEAAKVIENAQRDINIAFINELAKIFNLLNIDTTEVLEAAATKWNFLPFKPGLVGGHCIGVDPFYLAQKAKELGYLPEIILAGRKMNDSMGSYVAGQLIKLLIQHDVKVKGARVLILGITFKENCPDIRNSKVVDLIRELQSYGVRPTVYDPLADKEAVAREYQLQLAPCMPELKDFAATLLAVGHDEFKSIQPEGFLVYDIKSIFPKEKVSKRL